MKSFVVFLVSVFFLISAYTQTPQGINYQAIARNSQGNTIQNQNLEVRITIHSDAASIWSEDHSITTNAIGLFSLVIGNPDVSGSGSVASFDQIKWGEGKKEIGIQKAVFLAHYLYPEQLARYGWDSLCQFTVTLLRFGQRIIVSRRMQ